MKAVMKIIFAPIMALMWIAVKLGSLITYISGLALGITSGIIALISIAYIFTGSVLSGMIGLVIAYLLSPYGIPMFTIMILGVIQRARVNLQSCIYR
jgi:hypothetical protein